MLGSGNFSFVSGFLLLFWFSVADERRFQVSYAIGIAKPLSVMVFSFGTSALNEAELLEVVNNNFDLRPGMIIR